MEAMLNSVLFARDKWLSRGGLILPNVGNLWITGAQDPHRLATLNFWQNVEGIDMSCVKKQFSPFCGTTFDLENKIKSIFVLISRTIFLK